jgi:hypothetical protein
MARTPHTLVFVALAWTLATGAGAAPGDRAPGDPGTLKIDVRSEDGSKLKLEVASSWVGAFLDRAEIECTGKTDRRTRQMMESLQAQGEGGVWKGVDRDGDRVHARRSRGMLKLENEDEDGDVSTVEMPWEVARCLFSGVDFDGDLAGRVARGEARFAIDVRDDGDRVQLRIE